MKKRLAGKSSLRNNRKSSARRGSVQAMDIIIRYIILLIIGFVGLFYFYKVLFPLTIYPSYFLLKIFYNVYLNQNTLVIGDYNIEIISACIAGAAYYLLIILNLTTPMKIKKRVYSLIYSLFALLLLNIIRIFTLSVLFVNNFAYFNITHKIFWNLLSTIFVVLIWFSAVKIFSIKSIPVYSDIKFLKKQIKS